MKKAQRANLLIGGLVLLLFIIVLFGLSSSRLRNTIFDTYGRNYNKNRAMIGQPIIEEYFVLKSNNFDGQTWITPDSTERKVHDSKYIRTILGQIDLEVDYYNIILDSASIKRLKFDTLHYETIVSDSAKWKTQQKVYPNFRRIERVYSFKNDSTYFDLTIYINKEDVLSKYLDKVRGDSLVEHYLSLKQIHHQ